MPNLCLVGLLPDRFTMTTPEKIQESSFFCVSHSTDFHALTLSISMPDGIPSLLAQPSLFDRSDDLDKLLHHRLFQSIDSEADPAVFAGK